MALKSFSLDLQPMLEAKSATVIWTRENKVQGIDPWFEQTFVEEEDCVTDPKNDCVEASVSPEKSCLALELARFVSPSL